MATNVCIRAARLYRRAAADLLMKRLNKMMPRRSGHLIKNNGASSSRETREGTYKIGERMSTIGNHLYRSPLLSLYKEKTANGEAFGYPAIVFTMIAHQLNVPLNIILSTYLYSTISSPTRNAVRGIPLGQTAGQFILHDIQQWIIKAVEQIRTMDIGDFGAVAPGDWKFLR